MSLSDTVVRKGTSLSPSGSLFGHFALIYMLKAHFDPKVGRKRDQF